MISNLLLRVSVVLLLVGLLLGMVMAMQQNFMLAPAHAHLNLVGFMTMFVAGLYYRLVPAAAAGILARVQAALHVVGAILVPAGIALVLVWGPAYELAAVLGAVIVMLAILLFAVIVFRTTTASRGVGAALVPGE
jgi:hypothetical protein